MGRKRRPLLPALAVIIALAAIVYYSILGAGWLAQPTTIEVNAEADSCSDDLSILAEARDHEGERLPDVLVDIIVEGKKADSLYTDRNGRVSLELGFERSWCGRTVTVLADLQGDGHHLPSSARASVKTRAPTILALDLSNLTEAERSVHADITLTDFTGRPLPGKTITLDGLNMTTDSDGSASFMLNFSRPGTSTILASFAGDGDYEGSSDTGTIVVSAPACEDGTLVGRCSGQFLCTEEQELAFSCSSCGCPSGLLCIDNGCISEEERIEALVAKLQKSTVLIRSDDGVGSGVIISSDGNETLIITNRHVVDEDFDFASSKNLELENYEDEVYKPYRIYLAPNDLDLAVVAVKKRVGPAADVGYNTTLNRGAEVLAMGSPLGIQNSVSKGIISNFFKTETRSEYEYEAIQTDAAVNPGNSGGGIFLVKNGQLIGVTTFKLVITQFELAEGLGFAIPVSLVEEFPINKWRTTSPN